MKIQQLQDYKLEDYNLEEICFRKSIADKFETIRDWNLTKMEYIIVSENPNFSIKQNMIL